jgi:hypothetical protein
MITPFRCNKHRSFAISLTELEAKYVDSGIDKIEMKRGWQLGRCLLQENIGRGSARSAQNGVF